MFAQGIDREEPSLQAKPWALHVSQPRSSLQKCPFKRRLFMLFSRVHDSIHGIMYPTMQYYCILHWSGIIQRRKALVSSAEMVELKCRVAYCRQDEIQSPPDAARSVAFLVLALLRTNPIARVGCEVIEGLHCLAAVAHDVVVHNALHIEAPTRVPNSIPSFSRRSAVQQLPHVPER